MLNVVVLSVVSPFLFLFSHLTAVLSNNLQYKMTYAGRFNLIFQNKAAAQAYRQRKKSISELVETEYDLLLKQNVDLLGRKSKLEGQVRNLKRKT